MFVTMVYNIKFFEVSVMNGEYAKGKRIRIACDCWFTSDGKMTPLMIKLKDENGEIQTIRNLIVISQETLFPSCSPTTEFLCQLTMFGQKKEVVLSFNHCQCKWEMVLI